MTAPANQTQPQPLSRQRMLEQLNVLAQAAQAKSDAIRARRFSLLFSPRARLRLVMIRHAMEALALLVTIFTTPAEAVEAPALAGPVPAGPIAATSPAQPARAATSATPQRHHSVRRPARQFRAVSRPASPPQRAGAAPNPNSTRRARQHAPHRPLTPGALSQRLPQAALTR